jgi:hypothetical protein
MTLAIEGDAGSGTADTLFEASPIPSPPTP